MVILLYWAPLELCELDKNCVTRLLHQGTELYPAAKELQRFARFITVVHYTDTKQPAASFKKEKLILRYWQNIQPQRSLFSRRCSARPTQVTAALRPTTRPGRQVRVNATPDIAQCIIAVPSWRNMRFWLILHNIWLE